MQKGKHIFLIGMPGVGKSRTGIKIAQKLNLPFVDTDYYIMDKSGISIPEMIERYGVSYFRKKEHEVLKELISRDEPQLISTGGGMPVYNNNMNLMKSSGTVFWLDRKIDDIFRSYKNQPRAGIQVKSQTEMKDLYQDRRGFYEQADLRVDIGNLSIDEIEQQIISYV